MLKSTRPVQYLQLNLASLSFMRKKAISVPHYNSLSCMRLVFLITKLALDLIKTDFSFQLRLISPFKFVLSQAKGVNNSNYCPVTFKLHTFDLMLLFGYFS